MRRVCWPLFTIFPTSFSELVTNFQKEICLCRLWDQKCNTKLCQLNPVQFPTRTKKYPISKLSMLVNVVNVELSLARRLTSDSAIGQALHVGVAIKEERPRGCDPIHGPFKFKQGQQQQ